MVAFVTVKSGIEVSRGLKEELRDHVSKHIGAIAKPDEVRFAEALPKTRSGKIMRRLLKEIAKQRSPETRRRWRTSACWQSWRHLRNRHICPMLLLRHMSQMKPKNLFPFPGSYSVFP